MMMTSNRVVLHGIVLHCIALHCIVLCYNVLYCKYNLLNGFLFYMGSSRIEELWSRFSISPKNQR